MTSSRSFGGLVKVSRS